MALCCIHLPSTPLKNKLFLSLVSMNTTNKHTQHNNAKGPQKGKKQFNILKGKLQTVLCTRSVVYKNAFLHAPSQGRRLRPNSLAKDAHNQLQSWFSPEWKLILWQELLNLPETHTATDHKGTSPFPKEGRSKAPANNKAMAYHGLQDIKDKHAQQTVQTKQFPCKVINVTHKKKSHICKRTAQHKRLQHTSYHTSSSIRTGNEQCLWFQPATLRLTLSNHCPSQTKRIPDDPKPTDHNGQYTQSTSVQTFRWSVAGPKLQKMD